MIRRYIQSSVYDFLLCALVACCISRTVPEGFYVARELTAQIPLLIGVTLGTLLLLFAGAYSRKMTVAVTILFIGGIAVAIAFGRASGADMFTDSEKNPYIYLAILLLSPVAVFLLSRTKAGCIALFAAGVLLLCALRFLYEKDHLAEFIIFLVATGTLYALRSYRRNMATAKTAKPGFAGMAIAAALVFTLTVSLGAGAYYGIVKPLDPPARELKLITRYLSLQTLERLGIADEIPDPDEDLTSDRTNNEDKRTKPGTDTQEETPQGVKKDETDDDRDKNRASALSSATNALFRVIRYLSDRNLWLLAPLLLCAGIGAAIAIKKIRRRRWLVTVSAKPPGEQILLMYRYYLRKLRLMKVRKAPDHTLYQFAESAAPALQRFRSADADFGELTEIYVKTCYSDEAANEEEVKKYRSFHREFYKNCRAYLGRFPYAVRFFKI
ncbi:MAG: hypothetical protein LBC58_01870 [Clostridiales Family XIII bacterium]|jgi:hypothetical protein|nr:hypothetical protein [Clostridiales Family XIII bacterium]